MSAIARHSEEVNGGNVKALLCNLFEKSLRAVAPDVSDIEPVIAISKLGQYQCNNAMGLFSKIKGKDTEFKNPTAVGMAIYKNLPQSEIIEYESCSVTGPGFVNIVLSKTWMAKTIQKMLLDGIQTWAPKPPIKRAVVDFSSPNIAKELHVGHLRSTIIGDSIARMLEFSKVEVLRRNHVGDWGTQFGMLIEYLFEDLKGWEDENELGVDDLQSLYKKAQEKFKKDPIFKETAQKAVVKLQGGDTTYRKAWEKICAISRREYEKIYQRLDVKLEEKGESFYHPFISHVLKELKDKGLVKEDQGALVIPIDGKRFPLIVTKSDGGYNYASTDLAALWYRLNEEKADWIIYVTDSGQSEHFDMIFHAAKRAGWLPCEENVYPRATHVPFGLVKGTDKKRFRTRSTEVVRLADLLDEAISRSRLVLVERGKAEEWTEVELEQCAEAIGYGAVKYADLKSNRLTDYTFDFDRMLADKGDTAVFLLYEYARICSVIKKSGKDIEELKRVAAISLDHACEHVLGLHLLQFSEVVEEACKNLLPSVVCDYVYNLAKKLSEYYHICKVLGTPEEDSRLLLYEVTRMVMRTCFHLLGITWVDKM